MRIVLAIFAALMLLMGLLWIGQGTGIITWPASSTMIDQRPWAIRGSLLVILGAATFWFARRR